MPLHPDDRRRSDPFAPVRRDGEPIRRLPRMSEVPDGTAIDVLEWVGTDPERAAAALQAEENREKPRKVLMRNLAGLIIPTPERERGGWSS